MVVFPFMSIRSVYQVSDPIVLKYDCGFNNSVRRSNDLTLLTEPFYTNANNIARPQVLWWIHPVTDASGSAGKNNVARIKCHELA
jgi:hypothetical protein